MTEYLLRDAESNKFAIDYAAELNGAQLAAVETVEGPVLIIAGAGSGKTRTLVYRMARLIELGIPAESILLLTFTRKASEEMLRRAVTMTDDRCRRVSGGTFHHFANMVLRRYASRIGFSSSFTILDRPDSEDIIFMLRSSLGVGGKRDGGMPRKDTVGDILSKAVNKRVTVEEVVLDDYPHLRQHLGWLTDLDGRYRDYKRERNLMDYDDLLINLRRLLADDASVRESLGMCYRFIMVDEYQDTNRIQAEIVRLLASAHDNVMAVGDDSQSIYSFRGARFENIIEFPKMFSGTKVIKLEENFRSTQPILDLTNAIVAEAEEKYEKHLYSRRPSKGKPTLVRALNDNDQSRFVAQRVEDLREEGVALSDMAVLFRAGYLSFDLELELSKRGIPFVKYGGMKFMETAHVRDVLAYLKVVHNPLDAVSWNRVLLLIEHLGPKAAQDITAWVSAAGGSLSALGRFPARRAYSEGLSELVETLTKISELQNAPAEALAPLFAYYFPQIKRKYDDYPKRIKDLEHLRTMCARYASVERFLAEITLEPPTVSAAGILTPEGETEQLVLSTVHSAKGLEWHTVFIISAVEGRFPSSQSFGRPRDLEEERRLMYVATTRAKDNLYIIYPIEMFDWASGMALSKPSRFVADLPPGLLEQLILREEKPKPAYQPETVKVALPPKTHPAAPGGTGLRVGARVRHAIFGPGTVSRLQGSERAEVIFDRFGLKRIHLGYARLEEIK
ncbi:MAG: ATP-dependent helicase [Pseudomonadota bacterium]